MAMSARVTNANGRIVAEKRGGSRRYHQHDALGSAIALVNDAGTVTNTFEYWPYGELRTPVIGNLPTPFLFCGQWGYYTDTTGRVYVRARTYRPVFTRWLMVDRLWPWESAYGYVGANPLFFLDPSGLYRIDRSCQNCNLNGKSIAASIASAAKRLYDAITDTRRRRCILRCLQSHPPVNISCLTTASSDWAQWPTIFCSSSCRESTFLCPSGCDRKEARFTDICAYAGCHTSAMRRSVTFCCNADPDLFMRRCCCPLVYRRKSECLKVEYVFIHELLHICANGHSDCNNHEDYPEDEGAFDRMVKCIQSCL